MNDSPINRRTFHAAMAGGLTLGAGAARAADGTKKPAAPPDPAADAAVAVVPTAERDYPAPSFKPRFRKPQTSSILVQDFVIYAHFDLEMVEYLLLRDASLVYATVDWGGGDWESGLGAAAHIGRRDIAEFLLSKGARIDIFCAAMLGHLDVVKSLLASHPQLLHARGPHGIPLIAHAKAGKEQAAEVLAFLDEKTRAAAEQNPAGAP